MWHTVPQAKPIVSTRCVYNTVIVRQKYSRSIAPKVMEFLVYKVIITLLKELWLKLPFQAPKDENVKLEWLVSSEKYDCSQIRYNNKKK